MYAHLEGVWHITEKMVLTYNSFMSEVILLLTSCVSKNKRLNVRCSGHKALQNVLD